MSDGIFDEGGEFNIRRTGQHQYSLSIPMEKDEHGRSARQCPSHCCSPGYFKVMTGTGIVEGQLIAFCPYCRHEADPAAFMTDEQRRYMQEVVRHEVHDGIHNLVNKALGLGPSGRKKIGGGLVSIEITSKRTPKPSIHLPVEDSVQRDVICPNCTLNHAVFGLATWCPDCGHDIFLEHLKAEFNVVRSMLKDIVERGRTLGPRVALKGVENCLEDVVSIWEAVLKLVTRRAKVKGGMSMSDADRFLAKEVRNRFQNPTHASELLQQEFGIRLFDGVAHIDEKGLIDTFEKRHPITHNLGVVDRKYFEKVESDHGPGREVSLTLREVSATLDLAWEILDHAYTRLVLTETQ